MRLIKFRVWDCDNEGFETFDFQSLDSTRQLLDSYESYFYNEYFKRNPEYIQQFTGLLDKNGTEIYEGDLLRYPGHPVNFTAYEVFFHDGDANWDYNIGFSIGRTHHHGNIAGGYIPSFKPKTTRQMEVIGNVHQNPELLKQLES
jgi:uncharacterized phage protein (TIGR01671 family)